LFFHFPEEIEHKQFLSSTASRKECEKIKSENGNKKIVSKLQF
jgi:hypothetical protein